MTVKPSVESHVNSSSTFDGRVWWLRGVCLSVMIILVDGGVSRLAGSGLSVVDWRPVSKQKLCVHIFPRPLSRIMDAPKLKGQMKRGGYFLHFSAGFIRST